MMPILTWEYKGVDMVQLARNKSMPEVVKVKNMDGVVCRYVPERTCHLVRHGSLANLPSFICWSCSECGFGWHHSENDKHFSYCPNCGARVVE